MADREKVFDAIRNCVTEPKCKDCPWEDCEKIGCKRVKVPVTLLLDTLELLKEQPKQKNGHWKAFTQSRYFGNDDDGEPIFRDGRFYVCSECRRKTVIKTQFCPRCGAMMNEVKQDD